MDRTEESQRSRPSTTWDTFILASCARLASFAQVHMAPRFPPDRLNLAMRTQLPLLENELLVALIDSDAGGFQSEIILTTARLYWFQRDAGNSGQAATSGSTVPLRAYGMDYTLVPAETSVVASAEGTFQVVLGPGQAVSVHDGGRNLAEALAGYLRTVGQEARKGVEPQLVGFDPRLVERIASVLPKVAEVTRQTRVLNRDVNVFRRDLLAATAHIVVTPVMLGACILVFVAMSLKGVNPFLPTVQQLLAWGANDGARVVLRHEVWRLPASVFIHGGLLHLAVNMWCLYNIGPLVERFFGNVATAAIYLAAGVGGAIASMATLPVRVSVGASGAIFGLLGALLAFLLVNHRSVPTTVLNPLRSSALSFVIFNTIFGAAVPIVDQSAHLGGLATGFLAGLVLIRPWPVVRTYWLALRRLLLGLFLVAAVLGAGVALVHWREHTLPPLSRLEDFNSQAVPAIEEFDEISQAIPDVNELAVEAKNGASRQKLSGKLHALEERARANLNRLGRIITPDPSLKAIGQSLVDGQTAQIAMLAAEVKYLETRDSDCLVGPGGVLDGQATVLRSARDFQSLQRKFVKMNGLTMRGEKNGR